jgi:hypothetical protein
MPAARRMLEVASGVHIALSHGLHVRRCVHGRDGQGWWDGEAVATKECSGSNVWRGESLANGPFKSLFVCVCVCVCVCVRARMNKGMHLCVRVFMCVCQGTGGSCYHLKVSTGPQIYMLRVPVPRFTCT